MVTTFLVVSTKTIFKFIYVTCMTNLEVGSEAQKINSFERMVNYMENKLN